MYKIFVLAVQPGKFSRSEFDVLRSWAHWPNRSRENRWTHSGKLPGNGNANGIGWGGGRFEEADDVTLSSLRNCVFELYMIVNKPIAISYYPFINFMITGLVLIWLKANFWCQTVNAARTHATNPHLLSEFQGCVTPTPPPEPTSGPHPDDPCPAEHPCWCTYNGKSTYTRMYSYIGAQRKLFSGTSMLL